MANVKTLLIEMAVKMRPMAKMARVGLGVRLVAIVISSYFDLATDVLVTIDFFEREEYHWGRGEIG